MASIEGRWERLEPRKTRKARKLRYGVAPLFRMLADGFAMHGEHRRPMGKIGTTKDTKGTKIEVSHIAGEKINRAAAANLLVNSEPRKNLSL